MSETDDAKSSITDRVKILAAEVCRDEMARCIKGSEHSNRLDNIDKEVEKMASEIKDGFQKIADKFDAQHEKKDNNIFAIIQILLTAALAAFMAYKG